MKNFIKLYLGFFLANTYGLMLHAQQPAFIIDSLDSYVTNAMKSWQIPGVAIGVIKDGKVIIQKTYGVGNWHTKTVLDEKTVFPIASISKTFTGTLFATLEAEEKISTNDLVKKWLPSFEMQDKLYEQQITLADILSHRSGWKTFQGDLLNTESNLDYPSMIRLFGNQSPFYPIRTRFGYSNFGFIIAGQCVKNITKQTWSEYLMNRFLNPLGMKRTLVSIEDIKNETNKVATHTILNDSLAVLPPDIIEPYSHGGIFASIQDLNLWMKVLLNKGNSDDKNIIPEKAITKMWQSNTIIGKTKAADREMYFKTYGLGWEILQYQNLEVVQHIGAYSGALTSLSLVPNLNLGVVILTNQDNHQLQETLKWQVIDAYLQRQSPNYTLATLEHQKKRTLEKKGQPKENGLAIENFEIDLGAIEGMYFCDYYGKAYIKKVKQEYIITLEHHPNLQGVLSTYQKDKLTCTYNHPMFGKVQFPFVIEKNSLKSFTLYVDGFVESDGYVFKKIL